MSQERRSRTHEEIARASEAYRREMDAIHAEESRRATEALRAPPGRSSDDLHERKIRATQRYNDAIGTGK